MTTPEGRERLSELMDQRSLELQLTWREVAEAGGKISYEAIRNVRNGRTSGIARLTKRGIERGLQWEPGSVDLILSGANPIPVESRIPEVPFATTPLIRAAMDRHLEDIWARVRHAIRHLEDGERLTGARVFPDSPLDARRWDDLAAIRGTPEAVASMLAVIWSDEETQRASHRDIG